jgi:hypothetical protein
MLVLLRRTFFISCLATVLFMNQRGQVLWFGSDLWIQFYRATANWAYLVGFDNRWEMFSYSHKDAYRYQFLGVTTSGESSILPLPHQSDRSLWQRLFVDFREEKFLLNIYRNQNAKKAYGEYICREFPTLENVVVNLIHRQINTREEAEKSGIQLHQPTTSPFFEVACLK